MGSCTEATPIGAYGGDVYGDGVVTCDESTAVGYGGAVQPLCTQGWLGDPYLVSTIVQVANDRYIGHASKRYGEAVYEAKSYPECKKYFEDMVGRGLVEVRQATPGALAVIYLKSAQ